MNMDAVTISCSGHRRISFANLHWSFFVHTPYPGRLSEVNRAHLGSQKSYVIFPACSLLITHIFIDEHHCLHILQFGL